MSVRGSHPMSDESGGSSSSTPASQPEPKTKADFVKLLVGKGVPYKKTDSLDDIKRSCAANGLIPALPPDPRLLFRDLLDMIKIPYPKTLGVGALRALCVTHELVEPEFKWVEEFSIVKCALKRALAMDDLQYSKFSKQLEKHVNVISRMMRRTSLALSYHITRLVNRGSPVPDLYNQNDTFWKDWLRVGIHGIFPSDVTEERVNVSLSVVDVGVRLQLTPTASSALSVSYAEIGPTLEDVYVNKSKDHASRPPIFFDQVLNYAGHSLKTAVMNNAWVPLFARLGRLAKITSYMWRDRGLVGKEMHKDKLLRAVRSAAPAIEGWPVCAREWVTMVRSKLHATEGEFMFDNHGLKEMSFQQVVEFNHWMQLQFRAANKSGIRLMPIMRVSRSHVRLDVKTLCFMFNKAFPDDPRVVALSALRKEHAEAMRRKKAKRAQQQGVQAADEEDDDDLGLSNPADKLPKAPASKAKKNCTLVEWDTLQQEKAEHAANVVRLKAAPAYLEQKAKYDNYRGMQVAVVMGFFGRTPKRKGWTFDGSVATDGVSVSIQYSRFVRKKVDYIGAKVRKKKGVITEEGEAPATDDDYDRHATTILDDKAVLGLDPGRSNLATVAILYLDPNTGKLVRKSWSLSRGQYRETSGIKRLCKESEEKLQCMATSFHSLADPGSTLSAVTGDEILEYSRRYHVFAAEWWGIAIRRSESRDRLVGYMGKRRVLDKFFSEIKMYVKTTFPGKKIEVAYGEAGLTMAPTGKGEVAVPTGGTYTACRRIMSDGHDPRVSCKVTPVDESYTTAVSWEHGTRKELVYRIVRLADDQTGTTSDVPLADKVAVGHTANKYPPFAPERDREVLQAWKQLQKHKNKVKRGGSTSPSTSIHPASRSQYAVKEDWKESMFTEVRGLRFCPETRMYIDRDVDSAIAIGRLRTVDLLGRARPTPFTRPRL